MKPKIVRNRERDQDGEVAEFVVMFGPFHFTWSRHENAVGRVNNDFHIWAGPVGRHSFPYRYTMNKNNRKADGRTSVWEWSP